jgi:hypothetical protein
VTPSLVSCRAEQHVPPADQQAAAAQALRATASARSDFVSFVSRGDMSAESEAAHRCTAGGLRSLANALADALTVAHDPGARPRTASGDAALALASIRRAADSLEVAGPQPERHAALARSALLTASDVLAVLPALAANPTTGAADGTRATAEQGNATTLILVAAARQAAETIDPNRPLLEQAAAVHTFFRFAAQALRRIARHTVAGRGAPVRSAAP